MIPAQALGNGGPAFGTQGNSEDEPTSYDGFYAGEARIDSGATCLADGYDMELYVSGAHFAATVRRIGGTRDGTEFKVPGRVLSDGRIVGETLGGVRLAGFAGAIANEVLVARSKGGGCNMDLVLRKQ